MGPSAIRCAGVNERLECLCQDIEDLGDMTIGQREDEKEGGEPASEELRNFFVADSQADGERHAVNVA